jgi:acetylornithine deacetylase
MENSILSILEELIAINSVNRSLSGGPGEAQLADFIHHRLAALGIEAEIHPVAADRANVVGVIRGRCRQPSLILNGHIDTVGVDGMEAPFTLRREGDRLYGRGAYDMKGSVAVMLALAGLWAQKPPGQDVWLTFSCDEEDRSSGTESLVERWLPALPATPGGAIFLEPTEEHIGVAHKGFTWCEIEIIGRAAHGSRPEEGIDAVLPLRGALSELDLIRSELAERPPDPLLGRPSLHGGVIRGGSEPSVVPASATLCWERRTLPDEEPSEVAGELARVAAAVRVLPGGHRVRQREVLTRPAYRTPQDAAILARLRKASPRSRLTGLSFWADSALMGRAGVPSVLFGPAGHGAHAIDEWVSLQSLEAVYRVLREALRE